MNVTDFFLPEIRVQAISGTYAPLTIFPGGSYSNYVNLQFPNKSTPEGRLAIADRLLAGVQQWRDQIAAQTAAELTMLDELEAARAEIARLKGQADEAVSAA